MLLNLPCLYTDLGYLTCLYTDVGLVPNLLVSNLLVSNLLASICSELYVACCCKHVGIVTNVGIVTKPTDTTGAEMWVCGLEC